MSITASPALSRGQRAYLARDVCAAVAARGLLNARNQLRFAIQDGKRDVRSAISHPGHDGRPARAIDIDQHHLCVDELRTLMGRQLGMVRLAVDSEEAPESFISEPGTWVAIVDPLDGTSVLSRRGEGYAVALLLLHVEEDGAIRAAGGAVADSLGYVTSWCHLPSGGEIAVESLRLDPDAESDLGTSGLRWVVPQRRESAGHLTVAAVAATPGRRTALMEQTTLMTDPDVVLDLSAGNPALHALLSLETDALVELQPTRARDGIFLAALELSGFVITTPTGEPIAVTHELERLASSPASRLSPYVATVDEQAHAKVLRRIVRDQ